MPEKNWKVAEKISDDAIVQFPEYPPLVLQLLFDRGVTTQEQIDEFFNAEYTKDLHDPFLLRDMKKTEERILSAIHKKEKICIYGDYDADGVCGAVVLYSALAMLGVRPHVYIPSRINEGYSLNEKALSDIAAQGAKLVITVDCGSTNDKEIAFANKQGMDIIVVDHHLMPPTPPPAYAILNPKREGETYPFTLLCATGVAFKLAAVLLQSAFAREHGVKEGAEKWLLDIVAIGTVADMVPLLGENRTLVKYGLIVIEKTQRIGLRALMHLQSERIRNIIMEGQPERMTTQTIAFTIAPRINATSRMKHALMSFELLSTSDERVAEQLAREIEEVNNARRKDVEVMLEEARAMIEEEKKSSGVLPSVIFVGKDKWSTGLVGLVSIRLTEQYCRPSFVYAEANGHVKGSCRGIGNFHVVEAMRYCQEKKKDLFIDFGGHPGAGGFSVLHKHIDEFKYLMLEFGDAQLELGALKPFLSIDAEIAPEDITWEFFDWLLRFEPHGEGNQKPIFLMRDMVVTSARAVGKSDNHLKLQVKKASDSNALHFFDCIGFGLAEKLAVCAVGMEIDIVFAIEANEWNNNRILQLKLKDIKKSQ